MHDVDGTLSECSIGAKDEWIYRMLLCKCILRSSERVLTIIGRRNARIEHQGGNNSGPFSFR